MIDIILTYTSFMYKILEFIYSNNFFIKAFVVGFFIGIVISYLKFNDKSYPNFLVAYMPIIIGILMGSFLGIIIVSIYIMIPMSIPYFIIINFRKDLK